MDAEGSSVVRALEEDMFDFWVEFARGPGRTCGEEGAATWFRSGVPFVNYNGVLGVGCDVDAMLGRVRAWGVPARWIVSSTHAAEVEPDLARHGLELMDESPGMVARIEDLGEPALERLAVEVVTQAQQRQEWNDVFHDAFGFPPDVAAHVRDAHAWPSRQERSRTYLLMRCDGVPVATGLLHWTGRVAGVYGIGVRRAFRGRGFGALATLFTVRAGAERGAEVAVLQATKDGFPVYARLGFRTVCSFRSWRIV
jgi:hypothetical protein